MAELPRGSRVHERWAHLRFSVVGQLLAAPPPKGELRTAITELAARTWQHPTTAEPVRFGFSTIERWYYRALAERTDPVGVLRRKVRVPRLCHAPHGRGPAARGQRCRAPSRAGPVCRAQGLEHPAASRQPRRVGRDRARPEAGAVLPDLAPLHEGQRPRQAPASHTSCSRAFSTTHDRRRSS